MTELRNRSIKDVLIVRFDGPAGLPEAIGATCPKATVQSCVVHLIRKSSRYASWKDRKAIAAHRRPTFTAATVEAAEIALDALAGSAEGQFSPATVDAWRRAWHEFVPFLDRHAGRDPPRGLDDQRDRVH